MTFFIAPADEHIYRKHGLGIGFLVVVMVILGILFLSAGLSTSRLEYVYSEKERQDGLEAGKIAGFDEAQVRSVTDRQHAVSKNRSPGQAIFGVILLCSAIAIIVDWRKRERQYKIDSCKASLKWYKEARAQGRIKDEDYERRRNEMLGALMALTGDWSDPTDDGR
jgi:hypothetical protein